MACQSLMNPNDMLRIGSIYTVTGFAGYSKPGNPPTEARDVVILTIDDGLHRGDGWFAFWVPINCVEGVTKAG